MAATDLGVFIRQLTRTMTAATLADTSDRALVEQYLAEPREAIFEALVRRHGPMVYRVCWRVLQQPQDCEDAFQATFLILAQKLRAVRKHASLASWLHGVARRVALKARTHALACRQRERRIAPAGAAPAGATPDEVGWSELRAVLDAELAALPEKWRHPLILCYLEGRTQDEAADQLGWGKNTLRRRLAEGRAALARRLTRHGVWPAALAAVLVSDCVAPAALAPTAVAGVVAAVARVMAGQALHTTVPAGVAAFLQGLRAILAPPALPGLRLAAALVLMAGFIAAGSALSAYQPPDPPAPAERLPLPRAQAPGHAEIKARETNVLGGCWLMTLPAGFHYQVTLRPLDKGRYALENAVRFSGTYEFQKGRLVRVVPPNRGDDPFAWGIGADGKLTLVGQPPPARTGQNYLGATLHWLGGGTAAAQGGGKGIAGIEGGFMFPDQDAFRGYVKQADVIVVGTLKDWDGDKGSVEILNRYHGAAADKTLRFKYGGGLVAAQAGDKVLVVLRREPNALRLHSFCAAPGLYRYSDALRARIQAALRP